MDRRSLTGRSGTTSGFQPAMVRAHSRAPALSAMPGNSRRSSTAAENSPPRSNAARIAAASASVTTNMLQDGDEANAQQAGAVGGAEDVVGIRRGKNQWIAIAATYATGPN
jgi:hypothetical protein